MIVIYFNFLMQIWGFNMQLVLLYYVQTLHSIIFSKKVLIFTFSLNWDDVVIKFGDNYPYFEIIDVGM